MAGALASVANGPGTLEYIDGFSDYNTSQIGRYFSNVGGGSISSGGGRNGNGSFHCGASNYVTKTLSGNFATVSTGFAVKLTTLGAQSVLVGVSDASTSQCDLRINTNGTLTATRGGTVLGSPSTYALTIGVWYYIEVLFTINNSTGVVTVNVNNSQRLSLTSQNTRSSANNFANAVTLGVFSGSATLDYSDFYIDNSGTFYGDVRVETKLPNGNGATNQWTPLANANWQEVSDNPADDDTSYNFAATSLLDLYTYPALAMTSGNIYGVLTSLVAKNDTSGTSTLQSAYRSSGTNYGGSQQNISNTSYGAYVDIQATDPATSVAWTIAGVNAAQFGINRVS